jgi:hypothetical protein
MAALDAILRNPRRRQVEYGHPTICLCNNSRDRSSDRKIHYLLDDSILYHYRSRTPTKHEMNIPHFIASKAEPMLTQCLREIQKPTQEQINKTHEEFNRAIENNLKNHVFYMIEQ